MSREATGNRRPPHALPVIAGEAGILCREGLDPEPHHFGDISMILVGDFGQLEPIEDLSICDDETS